MSVSFFYAFAQVYVSVKSMRSVPQIEKRRPLNVLILHAVAFVSHEDIVCWQIRQSQQMT